MVKERKGKKIMHLKTPNGDIGPFQKPRKLKIKSELKTKKNGKNHWGVAKKIKFRWFFASKPWKAAR